MTPRALEERSARRLREEPRLRLIQSLPVTMATPIQPVDAAVCLYDLVRAYGGEDVIWRWHWRGMVWRHGFLGWRPMRRRWAHVRMSMGALFGPSRKIFIDARFDALSGALVKFEYVDSAEARWAYEHKLLGPLDDRVRDHAPFRSSGVSERQSASESELESVMDPWHEPDWNEERQKFIEEIVRQENVRQAWR